MSLLRPSASITLDNQQLTAAESGLLSLRVDLGVNSHDRVLLTLWANSKFADATIGSRLTLKLLTTPEENNLLTDVAALLGGGSDEALWTGTVHSVQSSSKALTIIGYAATATLSDVRLSATWSNQNVADIVQELASDIGAEIDADLTLANFSIDNSRSAWSYLYDLAQLTGAELSSAGNGALRFTLASKDSAVNELRYGADIIDWQLARNQHMQAVCAVEHAAASSLGSDKWHWLAHDPAGSNTDVKVVPTAFTDRPASDTNLITITAWLQHYLWRAIAKALA